MYEILKREALAPSFYRLKVSAPAVARKAQAGQFVMLMVDEVGERVPMTLVDWDTKEGSLTLAFAEVGRTTHKLAGLKEGDSLAHLVGPLGRPAEIGSYGTVALVAQGYGILALAPVARALMEAGNRVSYLACGPYSELAQENLHGFNLRCVMAEQGDGTILGALQEVLAQEKPARVIAQSPLCVMRLISYATQPQGIPTRVSLNPVMVDGTGMCGSCRVRVGGQTRFACVDGPEFDGHQVDWNELLYRRCTYFAEGQPSASFRCRNCSQW